MPTKLSRFLHDKLLPLRALLSSCPRPRSCSYASDLSQSALHGPRGARNSDVSGVVSTKVLCSEALPLPTMCSRQKTIFPGSGLSLGIVVP